MIFDATVSTVAGSYTNLLETVTSAGTLTGDPVQVGVGAARPKIVKSASVSTANPGDTITYTLTYSNDSPISMTGVVIDDTIPTGATFVPGSLVLDGASQTDANDADDAYYDGGVPEVVFNVGDLPAGDGPFTATFQVTVDNPYPGAAPIPMANTATISANEGSPESSTTNTFINSPRANLAIQKDGTLEILPGGSGTYTISYENIGDATATNTEVTDTIPAGFSFTSASAGGVHDGGSPGTVTWVIGDLVGGASGTVTVTITAADPFPAANPATNTATIDSDQTSPASDTFFVGVTTPAGGCDAVSSFIDTSDGDAVLSKIIADDGGVGSDPVNRDIYEAPQGAYDTAIYQEFTFPSDMVAPGATITDATLSDFNYFEKNLSEARVDVYAGGDTSGAPHATFIFDPSVSQNKEITENHNLYSAGIDTPAEINGLVMRFLSWSSQSSAAARQQEIDSMLVCVTTDTPPRLVINKQVDTFSAAPGDTIQYTIDFGNFCATLATGATIVDTLPTGVTFVSATLNGSPKTPDIIAGQDYTFNVNTSDTATVGELTPGESGSLVISVTVDSPLDDSVFTLQNNATLNSNEAGPESDSSPNTLVVRPDISVTKSADQTLLIPGDTVTFTISVLNSGDAAAINVDITDVIPSDTYFEYVSGSISGGDSRADAGLPTLTWRFNSVAAGATETVSFQMFVRDTAPLPPDGVTTKVNNATEDNDTLSGTRTSNDVTVSISTNANLRVTKTVTPAVGPYEPGDTLSYSILIENIGFSDATGVQVRDEIPNNTSYVNSSLFVDLVAKTDANDADEAHFDAPNNRTIFNLGTIAGGGTVTVDLSVQVDAVMPNGTTSVSNTAEASASNAATKSDDVAVDVSAAPVLELTKSGAENSADALTLTGADTDKDGAPNSYPNDDPDGDGLLNYKDLDADGDTIPDVTESGGTDANDDGIIDSFATDTDNDGFADPVDGDVGNDGIAENTAGALVVTGADTDSDGAPNSYPEANADGTGFPNFLDIDADDDGITDLIEAGADPNNPVNTDSASGDTVPDYLDIDADNDGIPDNIEAQTTTGYVAPSGTDSDGDGLDDVYDADDADTTVVASLGVTPEDTDGDTTPDYLDSDSDDDGLLDEVESGRGLVGAFSDADGDGLDDSVDAVVGPDVNDNIGDPVTDLTDTDGDALVPTGDVDYRDTEDADGDGIPDPIDLDDDNDGIPDITEGGGVDPSGDHDFDGIPNYVDTDYPGFVDANGDNVNDNFDNDGDGISDHLDLDSDNDGIPDVVEAGGVDADGDGLIDNFADTDNDGLSDNVDPDNGGTPLPAPDTDLDGVDDYLDVDSDNDGITDTIEAGGSDADGDGVADGYVDIDGDGFNDLVDGDVGNDGVAENSGNALTLTGPDTDNDGAPNSYPNDDFDGDGILNQLDIDTDDDGIPDNIEAQPTVGYVPPSGTDTDGDGLDDAYDSDNGGTPLPITNTDGTGLPDYQDLDADDDGISDTIESNRGTATGTDPDNDGLDDGFDDNIGGWVSNDGIATPSTSSELPDGDGDVLSGGDVNYRDSSALTFSIVKTDSGSGNYAIGDTVTYQVTLTIFQGVANNVTLVDVLPGDLVYDAGSAALSYAGMTVANDPPTVNYVAGTRTLTLDLGQVTNPVDAFANTIVISYDAIVENTANNNSGDSKANSATIDADDTITLQDGSGVTITGDGIAGPPPAGAPDVTIDPNATGIINTDGTNTFQYGVLTISDGATLTLTGDTVFTLEELSMGAGSTLVVANGSSITVTGPCVLDGDSGTANYATIRPATPAGNWSITFNCGFIGDHFRFEDMGSGKVTFNNDAQVDYAIFDGGSGGNSYICYCDNDDVTWTNLAFGYGNGSKGTIETCGTGSVDVDGYASTIANVWVGGDPTETEAPGTTVDWLNATPVRRLNGRVAAHPAGGIAVSWTTVEEHGNRYFRIERRDESASDASFREVGRVASTAAEFSGADYAFHDRSAETGHPYCYRIAAIDGNGAHTWYEIGIASAESDAPAIAHGGARASIPEDLPQASVTEPVYAVAGPSFSAPIQTGTAAKAAIAATGIYIAPTGKKIYNLGHELPLMNGIVFFARAHSDFYTSTNTVFAGELDVSGEPGTLPEPLPDGYLDAHGYTGRYRTESNALFSVNPFFAAGPNWYHSQPLTNSAGISSAIHVHQPGAGTATLIVTLRSDTEGAHDLVIALNGSAIARAEWSGQGHREVRIAFDASDLRDGSNSVELAATGPGIKRLDYVEIETPGAPRITNGGLLLKVRAAGSYQVPGTNFVVDATDFGNETRLAANSPLAPGQLIYYGSLPQALDWSEEQTLSAPDLAGIDYLAIAPADFLNILDPLLARRRAEGLNARAISLETLTDVYGAGIFGPAGIQALAEQSSTRYLLLAAGTTYDYHGYERLETPLGIPTGWVQVHHGMAATDDIYTRDLSLAVGRLPARSRDDLQAMVDKIVDFSPGVRVAHIADVDDSQGGVDRFAHMQEALETILPSTVIKASDQGETAQNQIINAIADGARIITYQGHAGSTEIGAELVTPSSIEHLPPVAWLLATCLAGSYHVNNPDLPVISREMLRRPGAGAVSVIASTRFGHADEEHAIVETAMRLMKQGEISWGDLLLELKRTLDQETIQVFTLLGDPALPSMNHNDDRVIRLDTPRGGDFIGGSGPIKVRFHLEGADWHRETLRIYWSRNNGGWHAIGDVQVDPGQGSYSIDWNAPEEEGTSYRIKIEEVLP